MVKTSRIDEVPVQGPAGQNIRLFLKRDDLLHPEISGNKWRKLKYHIHAAKQANLETLLTFGGAYSNHIAATAAAGAEFGFTTVGIIRGEKVDNPTLALAGKHGMQLHFVSREQYRNKDTPAFMAGLRSGLPPFHHIPEGGADELGVMGCEEILDGETEGFNYICCACGTGTTAAGLARAKLPEQCLIGFSALKGGGFLQEEISRLAAKPLENFSLQTRFHFGGYARVTNELIEFITNFKVETGILLDPVYTGKMMFGIAAMAREGTFAPGSRILAIHTGGLQGWKGFEERFSVAV